MTDGGRVIAKRSRPEANFDRKFGKDGHLTIVGVHAACQRIGGKLMYKVQCSTCVKDTELFGDGIFSATLANLTKGSIPCGCARNPWWSAEQSLVRVLRATNVLPCELIGYAEPYRGFETRLHLRCKIHGTEWNHTTVHTATTSKKYNGMCTDCEREAAAKRFASQEDVQAKEILSAGMFPAGTQIWRAKSVENKAVWGMLCGECSSDEFVENSLCTGIFQTTLCSLRAGTRPCRCSNKYKYNTHQRRHQIERIREDTNAEWVFTGFKPGTFERHIRMQGYCTAHGAFEKGVSEFVAKTSGCPGCSSGGGFKIARPAHLYVLNVTGHAGGFTGYGISNQIEERLVDHKRNLALAGFAIGVQRVFECSGRQAAQIELELKRDFPLDRQVVRGFKTEATYASLFDSVVDYVAKRVIEFEDI